MGLRDEVHSTGSGALTCPRSHRRPSCSLFWAGLQLADAAAAVERSVGYPGLTFKSFLRARPQDVSMVMPGDTAGPSIVAANVVLPLDYVPNSAAHFDVLLLPVTDRARCKVTSAVWSVTRHRAGVRSVSTTTEVVPSDGRVSVLLEGGALGRAEATVESFDVTRLASGDFARMQPGVTPTLGFVRDPTHPADACADDFGIFSAMLRYRATD